MHTPNAASSSWDEQVREFNTSGTASPQTLVAAVEAKNLQLVKKLVKEGAGINDRERPAVGTTLNNGKIRVVSDNNFGDDSFITIHVRHREAKLEDTGSARPFEEPRANEGHYEWVSDFTDLRRTALQTAADNGALDIVEYLLNQDGIDVDANPHYEYGRTSLQAAIECGHTKIVERLLAHGAQLYETPDLPEHRSNVMQFLPEGNVRRDIVRSLIYFKDNDTVERERKELYKFMSTLLRGDMKKLEHFKEILEELPDELEAMRRNNWKLAHRLLQRAAPACRGNRKPDKRRGICEVSLEILTRPKLIGHAANSLQKFGQRTALHLAAASNNEDVVQNITRQATCLLLDREDNHKATPLSLAVENNHATIIRILLDCGAATTSVPYGNMSSLLKGASAEYREDASQGARLGRKGKPCIVRIRGNRSLSNSKEEKNKHFSRKTEIDRFADISACNFAPDPQPSLDWLKPSVLFIL